MTRSLLLISLPTTAIVLATACGSDHGISELCGFPQSGFDIEEASVLQDAQAYPNMHDAVVLQFEEAADLPAGASWRVKSVEIMPMLDADFFDLYPDGAWVTVEVWDADTPLSTEPWRVSQQFFKGDHEWTPVTVTGGASIFNPNQMQTWWRFGFEDFIPTSGMVSSNYLVGVSWDTNANPPMGYSNFNRPCASNWTDYADGQGWVLNADQDAGGSCSWPMLRVNLEVLEQSAECEGQTYTVE